MSARHAMPGEPLLTASVAGRLVAIAASEVVQVLPMLPLWRPPTVPAPLRGFVEASGGVLPVLSARALLGLGEDVAPGLYAHIVRIGRFGGRQIGLLVDRAEGFVDPLSLEPLAAADTLNGCATAVFKSQGGVGWLIDPARLLGVAESDMLATLVAEARRRRAEWTVEA